VRERGVLLSKIGMAKLTAAPSREILAAALQGLEAQREKLDEQISQVRSLMGGRRGRPANASADRSTGEQTGRKKRVLSAGARKRIAAAQKRRWTAFRKNQA
jgi:hypothetical protein